MSIGRDDRTVLTVLAVAVLGFAVFAWLALSGAADGADRTLLLSLRNPGAANDPLGPAWLEEAARDITALGGTPILFLATLGVAIHLLVRGKARLALFAVLTITLAQAASEGLKALFDRPRPDLTTHEVAVYSASLPSGHAMLSAAALFTLAFVLARAEKSVRARIFLFVVAVVLTFLIGVSRVYLGVHWPTDVATGWCAGLAWASASAMIYRRLVRTETE